MKVNKMKNKVLLVGLAALLLTALTYSSRGISASTTSPDVKAAQNEELDFTLMNATGYDIKAVYVGASGTGDWDKTDEILHGKVLKNGDELSIQFHPKEKHEKWDLMVAWTDGYKNIEWLNLDLTKINKVTLLYDREKDKTWAKIE